MVDADQILVMKDGVIEEAGTHDELMERKGYYCSLYETQQELERYANGGSLMQREEKKKGNAAV